MHNIKSMLFILIALNFLNTSHLKLWALINGSILYHYEITQEMLQQDFK